MELSIDDFVQLVNEMYKQINADRKKEYEQRSFEMWGYTLPVAKEPREYVFRDPEKPSSKTTKTVDEIKEKAERIRKKHQAKAGD